MEQSSILGSLFIAFSDTLPSIDHIFKIDYIKKSEVNTRVNSIFTVGIVSG